MFLVSNKAIQRTQARQTDRNSSTHSLQPESWLGSLHSTCFSTRHECPLHTSDACFSTVWKASLPVSCAPNREVWLPASSSTAHLGCFPRSQFPWRCMAPFYRKINMGIKPIPQTGTDCQDSSTSFSPACHPLDQSQLAAYHPSYLADYPHNTAATSAPFLPPFQKLQMNLTLPRKHQSSPQSKAVLCHSRTESEAQSLYLTLSLSLLKHQINKLASS